MRRLEGGKQGSYSYVASGPKLIEFSKLPGFQFSSPQTLYILIFSPAFFPTFLLSQFLTFFRSLRPGFQASQLPSLHV